MRASKILCKRVIRYRERSTESDDQSVNTASVRWAMAPGGIR